MKRIVISALLTAMPAFPVAFSTGAGAHPHVLVDAASEIVFDAQGRIAAVRHHWRFDEAFSAFAVQGLDTDGDGAYTREELAPLAQINVESLSEYEFFTFLSAGDYQVGFSEPRDYWLETDGEFLTLHFTLPVSRVLASTGPVTLEVYDPEYFVAFSLPSTEAVRLANAPKGCSLRVTLARELDAQAQATLAEIGPEQRELPPELKELTEGLDNSATVTCS
ncbi:MAG TPA: DUF1007 family protein [Afifellaceae bacterium]|nr:DUF1007 family protein [Afifellaceae bacterium]